MSKARRVMGALGGAVVLALGSAGTASAIPRAYEDCNAGWVCIYRNNDGGDMMRKWSGFCMFDNLGQQGLGDQVSSAANYSDKLVYLLDWNGSDWLTLWTMRPGDFGNVPPTTGDRTDAVQVC